jgi:hypothetical protein
VLLLQNFHTLQNKDLNDCFMFLAIYSKLKHFGADIMQKQKVHDLIMIPVYLFVDNKNICF